MRGGLSFTIKGGGIRKTREAGRDFNITVNPGCCHRPLVQRILLKISSPSFLPDLGIGRQTPRHVSWGLYSPSPSLSPSLPSPPPAGAVSSRAPSPPRGSSHHVLSSSPTLGEGANDPASHIQALVGPPEMKGSFWSLFLLPTEQARLSIQSGEMGVGSESL